ncbi:hypothetical protein [Streptomyces puniciscabiei]|uniref:hypothetical protein n=1 Tax=Streptomyces puniciscabiei TaxID=164348 RepID=UPI003316558B
MAPIPEQARTEDAEEGPVRRGRHRKPRPRKVLLAAGGLALAAGVLSLVRVSSESGVGAPGTAEAEPRSGAGGGTTDHAADTATVVTAGPTALPSATSVMGGRSLAPTPTATATPTGPAAPSASAGNTAVPTATGLPTTAVATPGTAPRPSATTSAPVPAPTTGRPAPTTPAPTRRTTDPGPGGLCVPVLGLCVDAAAGTGR